MLLFADSGSTKTDWIVTDFNGKEQFRTQTIGLNPYFVTPEQILDACKEVLPEDLIPLDIEHLFFYGAGCGNNERQQFLSQVLEGYFPTAIINIYTDILGAARSIFQQERGIAAILGTGANVCVYNGKTVFRKVMSLGYLLGDEGSGSNIGKEFLMRYFNSKISKDLHKEAKQKLNIVYTEVMENLYMKPAAGKYLASFTPFLYEHIEHPDVKDILGKSFNAFFDLYINQIPEKNELPIGFCGSVAYFFQDIILEIAKQRNIRVVKFVREPLIGIVKYHLSTGEIIES